MATEDSDQEIPIIGKLVAPGTDSSSGAGGTGKASFFQRRSTILCTLFLVTGAIGIPLLWTTPSFSKKERIFWTVVVSIYTLILILGTAAIIWWAYEKLFGV